MASNPDRPHFGIIAGSLITSALALYYGTGLHPTWWLTWLAPFPLLLIVPRLSLWQAFGVSVLASFAGGLNMWHYFRHTAQVPLVLIVIFLLLPACIFALGVLLFRLCALRGSLLQAAIVYPAFWVSFEFLTASVSLHSTYGNLAYNQMNFLPILQIASVTGIWGISFCVLLFPATIAAICVVPGQARPKKLLAASVGVFLLAVLGFGAWRLHVTPPAHPVSVALIASDLPENMLPTTQEDSLRLFRDYAAQADALSTQHFQAIVLPEKIGVVQESYLSQADSLFSETASRTGAVVVVGLIRRDSNGLWNEARIYSPAGAPPSLTKSTTCFLLSNRSLPLAPRARFSIDLRGFGASPFARTWIFRYSAGSMDSKERASCWCRRGTSTRTVGCMAAWPSCAASKTASASRALRGTAS